MIPVDSITLQMLVEMTADQGGADCMIKADQVPMMKQFNSVRPLHPELPKLTANDVKRMLTAEMNPRHIEHFEETHEHDIAFMVPGKCRVRCNIYHQRGTWASVMRVVPLRIKSLDELGLPPILAEVSKHRVGLCLVTGPTGSGKTTTLAAMLDLVNKERECHIVTIEDPIEFVHPDQKAYVSQREIGIDTMDFQPAMRAALREAPDVILVGEMRDQTTMNIALQAGETGHMVYSTVHTASAYETMDRVINMFPPHEKKYMCERMGVSLKAIIAQKLIPRADGKGRVVANEVLICTPTVSKAITDGDFSQLYHHMNEGEFWGMQTMNQSLVKYVKAGIVDEKTALAYSGIASELKQMLRR